MKTNIKLVSLLLLAAAACGDNKAEPDARVRPDTGSGSDSFPAAPTLGAQIDRMGRPAVNTLLNHGFDPSAASAGSAKDAYNADTAYGSGWVANYRQEFADNLSVLDVLDTGMCGNLKCELGETGGSDNTPPACAADCGSNGVPAGNGCGNSVLYNSGVPGNPGATPNPASYYALASLLANDEIFLNTSKGTCALYLAVEYYVANSAPGTETTCGGRTPQYDVVDFSISMIASGVAGFTLPAFTPKIGDGAGPHSDYLADFPYLGTPH